MNVQITYAEIEDIIRKKVNLGLKLDYAADDTVKVSKLFGLISLKLRLSINTTNKINVEINTFSIVDKIACNNYFGNKIDEVLERNHLTESITFDENSRLRFTISLDKIDKLSKIMETIDVKGINIEKNTISVDIRLI